MGFFGGVWGCLFFVFGHTAWLLGSGFPKQGSNPGLAVPGNSRTDTARWAVDDSVLLAPPPSPRTQVSIWGLTGAPGLSLAGEGHILLQSHGLGGRGGGAAVSVFLKSHSVDLVRSFSRTGLQQLRV